MEDTTSFSSFATPVAARAQEGISGRLQSLWILELLAPLSTIVAVLVIGWLALDVPANSFRSPDEHASFIFTKTLAETGSLAYEDEYIAQDQDNIIHARGVLTFEGKGVPFNFLGLPVLYAPAYKLLGDDLRYIALPLAVITVVALGLTAARLTPGQSWIGWLVIVGALPILFSLFRPFMNVLPALAFSSVAGYFLLRYFQEDTRSRLFLVIAAIAFAIAALMRYELVILDSLFVLVVVLHKRGGINRIAVGDVMAFGFMTVLFFLLPLGLLNWMTYGSPTEYGYRIFNELYFPERLGEGSSGLGSMVTRLRSVLFPSYPIDFEMAGLSFVRQVVSVTPLFMITGGFGAYLILRSGKPGKRILLAYAAVAVYAFLYRGAGYSWLADSATPSLESSILRYSMPVYLGCFFLATYAIAQVKRFDFSLLLVAMLVVPSLFGVLRDADGNLLHVREQLKVADTYVEERILPATEPDALIYTDTYDKLIGGRRDTATWWVGAEGVNDENLRVDAIVRSMSETVGSRPVYLLVADPSGVRERLEPGLSQHAIGFSRTKVGNLLRVEKTIDATGQGQ